MVGDNAALQKEITMNESITYMCGRLETSATTFSKKRFTFLKQVSLERSMVLESCALLLSSIRSTPEHQGTALERSITWPTAPERIVFS